MFARHLLLKTMVPSVAQRLLGAETTCSLFIFPLESRYSASHALCQCCSNFSSYSSTPLKTQLSLAEHIPHGRFDKVYKVSSVFGVPNAGDLLCVRHQQIIKQDEKFHHGCAGVVGRNVCCVHHLLLESQGGLNSICCHQPARMLSFSPKAILEASPPSFQPYLRLIRFDKPIGTMLLFWPCTWSIALAAAPGNLPDARLLALFGAGAFFMRGAGCIINDMWDKDFDKKVERTKLRPLASGELTHFQGLVFLASQLSISLGILLQLNTYSIFLGAASMILVILYPLAKRYTYWPQVVLGVTLNWGVLLAWSALRGSLEWAVGPLYLACVLHTMFYDTIYSHQDKYDDMLIGVKSTALKLGEKTKPWLAGFSAVMFSCLTATGIMCDHTWPYFTGVALTGAHLVYQLYTVDLNNADDCAAKFRANSSLGFILFLGIVLGNLLRKDQTAPTVPALESQTVADKGSPG